MTAAAEIAHAAARLGLVLRGGFAPRPSDGVPLSSRNIPAAAVVLLGNAGGSMWTAFSASQEHADGEPHPLDRWTRRVVDELARSLGAEALYPFGGPPHRPFQRWAMRAEPVHPSPLGLLIHPGYGLWHAYRAALLFTTPVDLPPATASPSPCESCATRPCLSACPVGAFSADGYAVDACAAHLSSTEGAACMAAGCRARAACPVGVAYAYPPAQLRFHMAAFKRSRTS